MSNVNIICSQKWYDSHSDTTDLKYNNIFIINSSDNNDLCNKVVSKVKKVTDNEIIAIINDGYDEDLQFINSAIDKSIMGELIIYSKNLDEFDFTKIGKDAFILFYKYMFSKYNNNKTFGSLLDLQKGFIEHAIEGKNEIFCMNKDKNFFYAEVDESKIMKKSRVSKPNKRNRPVKSSEVVNKKTKRTYKLNEKPKLLLLTDVKGWAWWIKSEYIKKYLKPYYDIDIKSLVDDRKRPINYKKYDLYFTYGYSYVNNITRAPFERRISGITAHRPLNVIINKMKRVGWTHANSVLLYQELKSIHKNCFYVPNGVDSELFKPNEEIRPKNELVFGHIGKKSPKKGQAEYIEPAINKSGVKYYSHYNNYKSKVPHNKMPDMYRNFDVFLCASTEDGTPCPALEAAASGIPIISNKIGNMPELIENYETGILLEKKDIDLYVDAIKWCRNNPDKVAEMGRNIRKKIETEWTWELMARNYLRMFDYILQIERDLSYYENPALHHIKGE